MPRGKKRMSFHRTVSLALLIPINQGLFKNEQTPVVRKVDSAIQDSAIGCRKQLLDSVFARYHELSKPLPKPKAEADNTDTRF